MHSVCFQCFILPPDFVLNVRMFSYSAFFFYKSGASEILEMIQAEEYLGGGKRMLCVVK